MPIHYDLIVIGGGRASGLAIAAAKAGMKTALIERDKLGGACPNRGCVPSKLLIGFAEAARGVREAGRHFLDAELKSIDQRAIFQSVNDYVGGVDQRYLGRVEASGADLYRGTGSFTGPKTVSVNSTELTAETIVIGTGSRPNRLSAFEEMPVWTSDDLFPLEAAPPKSLLVIGGGFIGTEMGAFFSGIGTEVQLFQRGSTMLGRADCDIESVFQEEFAKELAVHCHAKLQTLTYDGSEFSATFDIHGEARSFQAERVLFAIGRKPNSDDLNLGATGLEANERGFIPVNEHLETSVPGIYAAGDVNGRYMLQHAASYEVKYLRDKIIKGLETPIDERLVAHAVYTHPEVASVGLTEEQLKASGTAYVSVLQDWLASARAMASRLEYPRIKLLVSPEDYSILGCHLIGPDSSTLIHQVLTLMNVKNDVRELTEMIYVHPALNEIFLTAAVAAVSEIKKVKA